MVCLLLKIIRNEWIIKRRLSHIIINQAHKFRAVDIKEGGKIRINKAYISLTFPNQSYN